jgi:serine/threonine-protein kinase
MGALADATDPRARVGSLVVEKFRIDDVLGEGGMGVVYKAVHLDLETPVAIKIVRDDLARREDVVERMLREARVAAKLRSEHVARVIDVGKLPSGAPYIVMEHLEGQDLARYLDEAHKAPPDTAVSFVLQVCEAVAEAHAAGIVHRDLKPDNLFLTTSADGVPVVKILDFGISKNLATTDSNRSLTQPSMLIGSPDYMSPEQMQIGGEVGPRSDIWSLGAVLYELLTGWPPFAADSIPAICARVIYQEPDPPRTLEPSIPEGLEEVVLSCLRKDPDARFQSVGDLAWALAPFGPEGSRAFAEGVLRIASGARSRSSGTHSTPRPERGVSQAPTLPAAGTKRRRVTVWGGMIAALGLGTPLLWMTMGLRESRVARPMPLAPVESLTLPVTRAREPSVPRAPPVASTSAPSSAPIPGRPPVVRKPAKDVDAWDPNEFGGRE